MIPTQSTIEAVNAALTDGDLVIDRGQVCYPPARRQPEWWVPYVDAPREVPHPERLDVALLRHVRENGPMTLALLYRFLDLACDANHTETAESLSRLKREGVLAVQGDEVRAVNSPEQSTDRKDKTT